MKRLEADEELDIDVRKMYDCIGVISEVPETPLDRELHATFLDAEKSTLPILKEMAYNNYGVFMIMESSQGNYHLYAPIARPKELVYTVLSFSEPEHQEHADIGYERGDWVLRISEKGINSSNPLSPKPELVDYRIEPKAGVQYSLPHIKFMRNFIPKEDLWKLTEIETLHDTVSSENLMISQYDTFQ